MAGTNERLFAFRFDVDTPRCAAEGVPNLVAVGRGLDVPFTFFVNFGRAVSRAALLKGSRRTGSGEAKLSVAKKLGVRYFLETLLVNPLIGMRYQKEIARAFGEGHEIGLHGGRNHALWQRHAAEWRSAAFLAEVRWGIGQCALCGIERPVGFASPGWVGSPVLNDLLAGEGFSYVADEYSLDVAGPHPVEPGGRLISVPTNIVGAGGTAYIEHLRAQGFDDEAILADFRMRLAGKSVAVVYDHPCYAGTTELYLVKRMVKEAIALGFTVTTLGEIARRSLA